MEDYVPLLLVLGVQYFLILLDGWRLWKTFGFAIPTSPDA